MRIPAVDGPEASPCRRRSSCGRRSCRDWRGLGLSSGSGSGYGSGADDEVRLEAVPVLDRIPRQLERLDCDLRADRLVDRHHRAWLAGLRHVPRQPHRPPLRGRRTASAHRGNAREMDRVHGRNCQLGLHEAEGVLELDTFGCAGARLHLDMPKRVQRDRDAAMHGSLGFVPVRSFAGRTLAVGSQPG